MVHNPLTLVNLATNPSFELSEGLVDVPGVSSPQAGYPPPSAPGGLYVHKHCVAFASRHWADSGTVSACVVGTSSSNDTHICPGGRDGGFELGLQPGGTYSASVVVRLEAPLTGDLNRDALTIRPGWTVGGVRQWRPARSASAPNEPGAHHLHVTFTVPADATAAWIRLVSGAPQGHGAVWWDSFILVPGEVPVDYFDGDSASDDFVYQWDGAALSGTSTRRLVEVDERLQGVDEQEGMSLIRTAIDRLDGAGEHGAAVHLLQSLMERSPASAWPIYRLATIHEARGEHATAADLYRRGAALAPTDPAFAGRLGKLAIAEKDFPEAVRAYEQALELDAGDERHQLLYGLGKALDGMGETERCRAAFIRGATEDPKPPPHLVEMLENEHRWFEPRYTIAQFVAENIDEIRERAEDDPTGCRRPGGPTAGLQLLGPGRAGGPSSGQSMLQPAEEDEPRRGGARP